MAWSYLTTFDTQVDANKLADKLAPYTQIEVRINHDKDGGCYHVFTRKAKRGE